MADEADFDLCECLMSREAAMRRLMAYLRQSQSYCTDTECYNELPGPESARPETNFLFLTLLTLGIVFFLIAFRPASLRSSENQKGRQNEPDDSAPPPLI